MEKWSNHLLKMTNRPSGLVSISAEFECHRTVFCAKLWLGNEADEQRNCSSTTVHPLALRTTNPKRRSPNLCPGSEKLKTLSPKWTRPAGSTRVCCCSAIISGRSPEISLILSRQKAGDVAKLPVEGDELYMLIQTYKARSREQGRFEAHQRHTDLQYLCAGQEWVDFCDLDARPNLPAYDGNGNLYFPLGTRAHSRLLLRAGNVAVLFPNDAHAPCLRVEGSQDELVRKIVVKVKDAHLANNLSLGAGLATRPAITTADTTTGVKTCARRISDTLGGR